MTADSPVIADADGDGTGWITLNRPQVHNAVDEALISELTSALARFRIDDNVRTIVISGRGDSFCAGADLTWLQRMGAATGEQNLEDAKRFASLIRLLDEMPKPTIAAVQGSAYGGGVAFIASCDIAISVDTAKFAMTEVKLGLVPGVISSHVLSAIGDRQSRRYFITGEAFGAAEALAFGLVHMVVPADRLEQEVRNMIETLAQNDLRAMVDIKDLIRVVSGQPYDAKMIDDTAYRIADSRVSPEVQRRITAYLGNLKNRDK